MYWDNLTDFVLIADLQQTDRQLYALREGGRDLLPQLLRQAILISSMPFSAQRSFTLTSLIILRTSALSTLILYSHLLICSINGYITIAFICQAKITGQRVLASVSLPTLSPARLSSPWWSTRWDLHLQKSLHFAISKFISYIWKPGPVLALW